MSGLQHTQGRMRRAKSQIARNPISLSSQFQWFTSLPSEVQILKAPDKEQHNTFLGPPYMLIARVDH